MTLVPIDSPWASTCLVHSKVFLNMYTWPCRIQKVPKNDIFDFTYVAFFMMTKKRIYIFSVGASMPGTSAYNFFSA